MPFELDAGFEPLDFFFLGNNAGNPPPNPCPAVVAPTLDPLSKRKGFHS